VQINTRFRTASLETNDIRKAGVLIHQFDSIADVTEPWVLCPHDAWCSKVRDRVSASLVSAMSPRDTVHYPKGSDGGLPLFDFTRGGLIFSPWYNKVSCAYPADAGAMGRICTDDHPDCIPGCYDKRQNPVWCTPDDPWGTSVKSGTCAWAPENLHLMMEQQSSARNAAYNEVVLAGDVYAQHLPRSIEAVFYIKQEQKYIAKQVHRALVKHFGIEESALPFLKLDPQDYHNPFTLTS